MLTDNLTLVPQTLDEIRARIEAMAPEEKAELSPEWLARLAKATEADPWTHGFSLVNRASGAVVGMGGFKGPPGADGVVEIAYGVDPDHRGKGYATEAAAALARHAFDSGLVRVVRAHTRPDSHSSMRVLAKSGFQPVGEVIDPEDGLVRRWEISEDPQGEEGTF